MPDHSESQRSTGVCTGGPSSGLDASVRSHESPSLPFGPHCAQGMGLSKRSGVLGKEPGSTKAKKYRKCFIKALEGVGKVLRRRVVMYMRNP